MPAHSHAAAGQPTTLGDNATPPAHAARSVNGATSTRPPRNLVAMAPEALAPAGGDQPHNNMQPYLTFYFCIALQGVFPPRS